MEKSTYLKMSPVVRVSSAMLSVDKGLLAVGIKRIPLAPLPNTLEVATLLA